MKKFKNFLSNSSGNIAILAALTLPVVALSIGGAIEFSQVHTKRMNLERAASAAVLASVSDIRKNASELRPEEISEQLKDIADLVFFAESKSSADSENIKISTNVTYEDQVVTTELTYTYTQDAAFLRLMGTEELELTGTAIAKTSLGSYTEFNILVDNSNSMAVGASQADIDYMMNNPPPGEGRCAFACHTNKHKYENLPIKLRIDVAKDAIARALSSATSQKHPDSVVKFGLYTFDHELEEIVNPSDDQSDNVIYMTDRAQRDIDVRNSRYSRIDYFVDQFASTVGDGGNGVTEDNPRKFVLVITDGVQFLNSRLPEFSRSVPGGEWGWERAQTPNAFACDKLKEQNVEVYFIYTTYLPNYIGSRNIDRLSRNIEDNILSNNKEKMKQCATSEDHFVEASNTDELQSAIDTIFKDVIIPTHIVF